MYLSLFCPNSFNLFIKLILESIISLKSELELRDKETEFSGNKLLVLIVKLFSVFDYIITFLTVEDKYNLALINKNSYRFFFFCILFIEKISFKNTIISF